MKARYDIFLIALLNQVTSEPCWKPKLLNLFALEADCFSTYSHTGSHCKMALDYNAQTYWHPSSQTSEKIFIDITFKRRATIKNIEIFQLNWNHGFITKLE